MTYPDSGVNFENDLGIRTDVGGQGSCAIKEMHHMDDPLSQQCTLGFE
jgi:hypothetical protein